MALLELLILGAFALTVGILVWALAIWVYRHVK